MSNIRNRHSIAVSLGYLGIAIALAEAVKEHHPDVYEHVLVPEIKEPPLPVMASYEVDFSKHRKSKGERKRTAWRFK